jgi:hypothetical protein
LLQQQYRTTEGDGVSTLLRPASVANVFVTNTFVRCVLGTALDE